MGILRSNRTPLDTLTRRGRERAVRQLADLAAEHHVLVPAVVVDAARPAEAPLHDAFEWNDPIAAEEYREQQARQLIRAVRVVTEAAPALAPVQAFVDVDQPAAHGDTFAPALALVDDPVQVRRYATTFIRELDLLLERFWIPPAVRRLLEQTRARAEALQQA